MIFFQEIKGYLNKWKNIVIGTKDYFINMSILPKCICGFDIILIMILADILDKLKLII